MRRRRDDGRARGGDVRRDLPLRSYKRGPAHVGRPYHVDRPAKPHDEALSKAHKPVSFRLTPMPAEACAAYRKATDGPDGTE